MILIKECQWKLILLRMVFSDYTKRRILFYHTKGYYAPTIVGLLQEEDIQVSRRSVSDFLIRFKQTLSLRTFFLLFLATRAKLHGRSWLQTGSRLLYTGRREALFEFECK